MFRLSVVRTVVAVAAASVLGTTSAWALTWEQEAKLLASDGAAQDGFGYPVVLDGDTAVIGAVADDDSGSAYVFVRTSGGWTEQAKLLASDGADWDLFGISIAVDGDTTVIGAEEDDDNGEESGSAYVFTRAGGVWIEQAKLLPDDGAAEDFFGGSVTLDGDTAVIGAAGAAYVFTQTGGVWTEQVKLVPSDGAVQEGFSVSLDGDSVVIGVQLDDDNGEDSGSAYVFTRTGGVWIEQAKLLPADGVAGDRFGASIALDGDSAVIGARRDDDNGEDSGSAYVFTRTGGVWAEQAKLLASDGAADDGFGSVALDGDTAMIGAWRDDDNGELSGSAYVFIRSGGLWTERAKLFPADGATGDGFGYSVTVNGDTALVSARWDDDSGNNSGSAYVFRLYDDGVPATGVVGTALLLLAMLGTGIYFVRRNVIH